MQGSCLRGATGFSKGLRIGCPGGGDALPGTSNRFVKREPSFNADYRGGVTCLYDTQLLGACLHESECGGRSRPEAVRGMPDVPIAPPATGPNTVRHGICSKFYVNALTYFVVTCYDP